MFFTNFTLVGYGQNCKSVSVKKDEGNGLITVSGIISSKDFYILLIQKQISYEDTTDSPKYILFLNISKVKSSSNTLKSIGMFHLKFPDSSIISLEGVSFFNRPLGRHSVGFKVYINEEVVHSLAINPIVTLLLDDKLKTDFKPKAQIQLQKICVCLLRTNPKP